MCQSIRAAKRTIARPEAPQQLATKMICSRSDPFGDLMYFQTAPNDTKMLHRARGAFLRIQSKGQSLDRLLFRS
jgi:hypothetical protein